MKLKPFSVARTTYTCPAISLSEEQARTLQLYHEYCRENDLLMGLDVKKSASVAPPAADGNKDAKNNAADSASQSAQVKKEVNKDYFFDLLVSNMIDGWIDQDREFVAWRKKNQGLNLKLSDAFSEVKRK